MRTRYLLVLITSCTVGYAQTPRSGTPDFSAIQQQLRVHVGNDDVPGLAIAVSRGGEILWEEGFGWADRERRVRATPSTPFYIASVTKSVTATAVLHLAERGSVHLDDPVNNYLHQAKIHSPVWNASEATIRGLLSHTSGLTTFSRWCSRANDPKCDIDAEIEGYGVLVWHPGEVFDYSNLGYGVLSHVVASVSAKSFDTYLQDMIFRPLKMRNCAITLRGPEAQRASAQYNEKTHLRSPPKVSGHEGASGLHCSAHDLLAFGMFHLKQHLASDSPLSGQDIDDMHAAQPGTRGRYGLGWWIRQDSGISIIAAQGGTADAYALLEVIPAKGIAIAVVANSYSQRISRLEHDILSLLLPGSPADEPASQPRAQASPAAISLAGRWSGQILTYNGPVNLKLEIGSDGRAESQIADAPGLSVLDVKLKPNHFYGRFPGQPGLPDSPNHPFTIELDLALVDNDLIGAATSGPLPGKDGDQLPHFVRLTKASP
jgi:CubicO group peptidase (beta-lactamase class C family)